MNFYEVIVFSIQTNKKKNPNECAMIRVIAASKFKGQSIYVFHLEIGITGE